MASSDPWLRIEGGVLDLGWRGAFPRTHNTPIVDPTALAIVTWLGHAIYDTPT